MPQTMTSRKPQGRSCSASCSSISPGCVRQGAASAEIVGGQGLLARSVEYARRDQKNAAGNPDLLEVLAQFSDPDAAEAVALQLPK